MKKGLKLTLLIIAIVFLFAVAIIIKQVIKNSLRIPLNDPFVTGNTAGNLYNGGLFAEVNGKVYFSNAYDNNNLYVMNPDQSELQKLATGDIGMINVIGDYVYYYSQTSGDQAGLGYVRNGRGLYRYDLNDNKIISLLKVSSDSMLVMGNNLYYTSFTESADVPGQAGITVDTISTEGENQRTILEEHIKLGSALGGLIYYAGVQDDHHLHTFSPAENNDYIAEISAHSMYLPIVQGSEVYFLDLEDDYHLKALSLSDGNIRNVIDERIDTYNVFNGVIYYQNCDSNDYALKRCFTDGTNVEVVKTGVYNNINITSAYVYFTDYNNTLPVYQTPTGGSVNITTFDNAIPPLNAKQ